MWVVKASTGRAMQLLHLKQYVPHLLLRTWMDNWAYGCHVVPCKNTNMVCDLLVAL
jgi:hypothetical protein